MEKFTALLFSILLTTSLNLNAQSTVQVNTTGEEQVHSVSTPGYGHFEITLDGDYLLVEGQFSDLRGTYSSAQIFHGSSGEDGNQLFQLTIDLDEDYLAGEVHADENRFELSEGIKEALSSGMLYINISTSRYERGELRGQIPAMDLE